MKLSIIIPCYNELNTIKTIIEKVISAPIEDKEVIIVDDCSFDGTRELLENTLGSFVNKIIYHENNLGYGAAVKTGIDHSTGDIIIIQDADLEYSPEDIPLLIAPIMEGSADVVYSTRFLDKTNTFLHFRHLAGNKIITFFSNLFTKYKFSDVTSCNKVFRATILMTVLPLRLLQI